MTFFGIDKLIVNILLQWNAPATVPLSWFVSSILWSFLTLAVAQIKGKLGTSLLKLVLILFVISSIFMFFIGRGGI